MKSVNNSASDLGSYDWLTTSGDENTCDNSGEWNDTGTTGCSYTCPIDFNLSLFKGWNLISIPVEIDNWVLPVPFSSIIGKYSNVFGFINGKWVELRDNDEINETMGLWINMIDNSSLVLTGSGFDYELVLEQGWNLIGYPSTQESPINGSAYNESVIYAYNNSWYSYVPSRAENALRYFTPGYGYWVKVG